MASTSSFGEFIATEYEVFKKIVSYMEPRDVWNARLVCHAWNRAVNCVVEKYPTMVTYNTDGPITPYFDTCKPILPHLILYQQAEHAEEGKVSTVCTECRRRFIKDRCPCSLAGPESYFISIIPSFTTALRFCNDPRVSCHRFCQHFMEFMLPSSENIKVSVFSVPIRTTRHKKFQQPHEALEHLMGGLEPVKCLLLFQNSAPAITWDFWINNVLQEHFKRHRDLGYALGGGKVQYIEVKRNEVIQNCRLVAIALRGDNLTAHSAILSDLEEPLITEFMNQLAYDVGPLPEGARRVAFITQCLNRIGNGAQAIELLAFKKALPSVPFFVFKAYGEFGSTDPDLYEDRRPGAFYEVPRRTTSRVYKFTVYNTSTYLILTFKKV